MVTSTMDKTTAEPSLEALYRDMSPSYILQIRQALDCVAQNSISPQKTGQNSLELATHVCAHISRLRFDAPMRIAALFSAIDIHQHAHIEAFVLKNFDLDVHTLLSDLSKTMQLEKIVDTITCRQAMRDDTIQYDQEILRKMLMSLARDIRVVVIIIAVQLEHLRYLLAHKEHGPWHTTIARECLALYAPLANRLGLWYLKWEMEDCAFHILEPERYHAIAKKLDERRALRENFIDYTVQRLRKELSSNSIACDVYGRPKHIYSIYNKMQRKQLLFEDLYDLSAVRVLVHQVKDCYSALGVVHNLWVPISREFDDYILQPKNNAYQSLHTAVICDNRPIEVQIRTYEMHKHAELGIAAHWKYKEGVVTTQQDRYHDKIALLRQLLSWRDEVSQKTESWQNTCSHDTVYVFTPSWQIIDLPQNATPLDLAYRIHTNLGHNCRGAKVNGQIVPLDYKLKTADRIDILTTKHGAPSRDWLDVERGFLHTTRARQKVRQYFLQIAQQETLTQGRALLQREMHRLGLSHFSAEDLVKKLSLPSLKHLYAAVYHNEIRSRDLQLAVTPLTEKSNKGLLSSTEKKTHLLIPVQVVGTHGVSTQLAQCCKPRPGDTIVGFITKGRGITIHRTCCVQVQAHSKQNRFVDVQWDMTDVSPLSAFTQDLRINSQVDESIPMTIFNTLAQYKVRATNMYTQVHTAHLVIFLTVQVYYHNAVDPVAVLSSIKNIDVVRL